MSRAAVRHLSIAVITRRSIIDSDGLRMVTMGGIVVKQIT